MTDKVLDISPIKTPSVISISNRPGASPATRQDRVNQGPRIDIAELERGEIDGDVQGPGQDAASRQASRKIHALG